MGIVIFAIIVIIVTGMIVWAEAKLPLSASVLQVVQALTVLVGALVIANRAGLL